VRLASCGAVRFKTFYGHFMILCNFPALYRSDRSSRITGNSVTIYIPTHYSSFFLFISIADFMDLSQTLWGHEFVFSRSLRNFYGQLIYLILKIY